MRKHLISALVVASFVVGAMPVSAAMSGEDVEVQARLNSMMASVNAHQTEQVSLFADRFSKSVDDVMKMNGITRSEAVDRISHSIFSQAGKVPKPAIERGYGTVYDPSVHAFRSAYGWTFYAGVDHVTGLHTFVTEKRGGMGDNFWYCDFGKVYTNDGATSSCK